MTRFKSNILFIVICATIIFSCVNSSPSNRHDQYGIEQVLVPAGSFMMGTSNSEIDELLNMTPRPSWLTYAIEKEKPQHQVTITKSFWIDRYEVTNEAFDAFVEAGGYSQKQYWSEAGWDWLQRQKPGSSPKSISGNAHMPRSQVNWYEAEAYAQWRGGRLPTEAEWEYAARGPESRIYPWGNVYDDKLCNIKGLEPKIVGTYPQGASWVGAFDLAGNLMEWVQDWHDTDYYKKNISQDPTGPTTGTIKIEKGGWFGSYPQVARAAYGHFEDPPTYRDQHIGFRVITMQK